MTRFDKKIQVVNLESFLKENSNQLLANPNEEKIKEDIPDKIIENQPEETSINNDLKDLKDVHNSYHLEENLSSVLESFLTEADDEFDMSMDNTSDENSSDTIDINEDGDNSTEETSETPEDTENNDMGNADYGEQDDNSLEDKLKNSAIIDNIISCYKNLDIIKTRLSLYIPMDKTEEDTFNFLSKEIEDSKSYITKYLEFRAYHQNSRKNYEFLLKIKGIFESVNNTMEIIVKSRNKNLTKK